MKWLDDWDKKISASLHIPEVPGPASKNIGRGVMRMLEYSGHGVPWLMLCGYGLLFLSDKWAYLVVNLLVALLLDLAVVGVLKAIVRRKRPHYNKNDMFATVLVDNFSFPSGHTTRATMLAYFCNIMVDRDDITILFSAFIWAICVAISRVMMGRHHVLDVVAGWVIGMAIFECAHMFLWVYPPTAIVIKHTLLGAIGMR